MTRLDTIIKHKSIIIGLGLLFSTAVRAQQLAVGNNLVYSATLTPNLSVETRLDSTWTMGFTGGYRPWPTDDEAKRKYRHLSLDLYARKWTGDKQWRGWYYGFDALWVHYNLSNLRLNYFGMFKDASDRRIQGNLIGAVLSVDMPWTSAVASRLTSRLAPTCRGPIIPSSTRCTVVSPWRAETAYTSCRKSAST